MQLAAPLDAWLEPLRRICESAADAIMKYYRPGENQVHRSKLDSSPLTAADLAAHHILLEGLQVFGLPVLSEESGEDIQQQRHDWQRYWLVDPLDGTREFLDATDEFTVNIALIDQGRAVFGMIAVPVQGSIYCGAPGQGAWKYLGENWQPIGIRALDQTGVVLTSRRHRGERLDAWLEQAARGLECIERHYIGSALKFCLLAEGQADFYPRYSPCCEWDTAAGQALLEAAGGLLVDFEGRALSYNQRDTLLNPHFLAVGDPGHALWRDLLLP